MPSAVCPNKVRPRWRDLLKLPQTWGTWPCYFLHASFTTITNVLPSDLFHSDSVASVSGLSGTGAATGTIVVYLLAGQLSDARLSTGTHLFDPLMIIAGLIPFTGMLLVLLLVRNTQATDRGLVRRI